MGKKKTKEKNQTEDKVAALEQTISMKESEISSLKHKLDITKDNQMKLLPFYGFYETEINSIDETLQKMGKSQIKSETWIEFLSKICNGGDGDFPIMISFALLDKLKVPFTVENAKIFYAFCFDLANIMLQMRG